MNKLLVGAAVIGFAFAASAQALAFDAEETRDVDAFDAIDVLGFSRVIISVGGTQSVSIEAEDEEHLEHIITEVRNGMLSVHHEETWHERFRSHDELVLRVSMTELTELEAIGIGSLDVEGISGGDIEISIVGSGRATLEGSCDELDLSVTGSGSLDARDLECAVVDLGLTGSGSAEIFASEEVEVSSVASGSVRVYGDPDRRDVSSTVSAKIRFAGN